MTDFDLTEAVRTASTEILEKMFFIEVDGETESIPSAVGENQVGACLTFQGDPPGWLRLRVTQPAARSMAADFLGVEANEISASKVQEVVCELANMICGSVLSRVESTSDFRLASPQIWEETQTAAATVRAACHNIPLPGGTLQVEMAMEKTACPIERSVS